MHYPDSLPVASRVSGVHAVGVYAVKQIKSGRDPDVGEIHRDRAKEGPKQMWQRGWKHLVSFEARAGDGLAIKC